MTTKPIIEVKDLKKSFGTLQVLKGINTEVQKGEVVVVIGKSTFLRCLNLLETPTAGSIYVDGAEITDPKCDINLHRQKMGMVFQHFNLFNNMTILHYQNHIGILNSRQTMSHNKAGASLHHGCKCFLDPDLGSGINRRGCLIQYQHRRQTQHHPCDTKKLLLSLGETSAIFTDHGIISLWKSPDKAVCMGSLCCRNHLFIGCIRLSNNNVVTDRSLL